MYTIPTNWLSNLAVTKDPLSGFTTKPMAELPANWNINDPTNFYAKSDTAYATPYRKALAMDPGSAFYPNAQNQISAIYNTPGARDSKGNLLTGKTPTYGNYFVPVEYADKLPGNGWNPDGGGGLLDSLAPVALGVAGNFLVPGLGAALGGGLLGSAGAGAIIGGATSGLTGGNILQGAALGGLGAGIGSYAGSNFSTNPANGFAGISPAQFASTAGKAGLGMLSGANPGQALTNGIAGLAGTSVASNFNSPWLQGLTGSATNAAIRGGDVGQAALYGGLGGLANSASSQFSNPWAKSLIASSPKLLSQYMNMQNKPQQQQNSPQSNQQAQMPDWVKQAMVALGKKGYSEAQARQMIQQRGRG